MSDVNTGQCLEYRANVNLDILIIDIDKKDHSKNDGVNHLDRSQIFLELLTVKVFSKLPKKCAKKSRGKENMFSTLYGI